MVSLFLLFNFGWTYALVTFVTVVGYIYYTISVTEWRIKFRRQMNEADSKANTKAIDSLLNYETVKYFSNEAHEADRLDDALAGYERSAIRSQLSLSFLNIGQGFIIAAGMVILLAMSAPQVQMVRWRCRTLCCSTASCYSCICPWVSWALPIVRSSKG